MYRSLDGASDLMSGLDIIYEGIRQFTKTNQNIWRATAVSKHHKKLSEELSSLISYLLIKFPNERDRLYLKFGQEGLEAFISENILLCYSNKDINIRLLKIALM